MGGDESVCQEKSKIWMFQISSHKNDGVHVGDSLNAGPVTSIKHGVVDMDIFSILNRVLSTCIYIFNIKHGVLDMDISSILNKALSTRLYNRIFSFCSPEVASCVNLIPSRY